MNTNEEFELDLQLFAEGEGSTEGEQTGEVSEGETTDEGDQPEEGGGTQKSAEEIRAELEEEFEQKLQSRVDKRVTEAVKKTEERMKKQFEEQRKLEEMDEEERKKEEQKKREKERKQKEQELAKREMKLDLIDILDGKELPVKFKEVIEVDGLIGMDDKDERRTKLEEKVEVLEDTFNSMVERKVEDFKEEYLQGETPDNLEKEDNNNPVDEYEEAKKEGDIKGMLSSKLFGEN